MSEANSTVNPDRIAAQVRKIIEDQFGVQVTSDELRLGHDLGADSLDLIEVILALEYEFEIAVWDEDADKHIGDRNTVADVIRYCTMRVAA